MSFVQVLTQPHCQKGIGRLINIDGDDHTIEWFIMPGKTGMPPKVVTVTLKHTLLNGTIRRLNSLPKQQRVYWRDAQLHGQWLVGRIDEIGGLPLQDDTAFVRVSGGYIGDQKHAVVPTADLYVRSMIAHEEAHEYTKIFWAENPILGKPRALFRAEYIDQRATFRGMTGLASSSIKMLDYQIDVVQHILNAPIQRFILGDEVGLGKTIEALAILRQYYLDGRVNRTQLLDVVQRDLAQDPLKALIILPATLVNQWREEIDRRINLKHLIVQLDEINGKEEFICIASYEEFTAANNLPTLNALIVDEVHLVCKEGYGPTYTKLHTLSQKIERVLLMSATPIVDNIKGYFKMLSVLDPVLYPKDDPDAYQQFENRFEKQLEIATIWNSLRRSLKKKDKAFLQDMFSKDPNAKKYLHEYEEIKNKLGLLEEELEKPDLTSEEVSELEQNYESLEKESKDILQKLRFLIGEVGRLDNRIVRNRREKHANKLAKRNGFEVITHQCNLREEIERFLNSWLDLLHTHQVSRSAKEWKVFEKSLISFFENPRDILRALQNDQFQEPFTNLVRNHMNNIENLKDGRLDALIDYLDKLLADHYSAIVFIPQSLIDITKQKLDHDDIYEASSSIDIEDFRNNGGILLCPPSSETGINLQDIEADLVMYNVPLRTERIEQRIGRVDRLGSILEQETFVTTTLCSKTDLDTYWLKVIEKTEVFQHSISSIQNRLITNETSFWKNLEVPGRSIVGALNELQESLNVSDWHDTVRLYDALSSIRTFDKQYDKIRASIVEDNNRQMWPQIIPWLEQLQFRVEDKKYGRFQIKHTTRKSGFQTLVPKNTLWNVVPIDYWLCDPRGTHGSNIYEKKIQAQNRIRFYGDFDTEASVCRIGSATYEFLNQICLTDDRGVSIGYAKPAEKYTKGLYFKGTIIIEGRIGKDQNDAWRRNLDYFIPPKIKTIWTNQEGQVITDPNLISFLDSYDDSEHTNLKRTQERWEKELDLLNVSLSDWDTRIDGVLSQMKDHIHDELEREKESKKQNVNHFFNHKVQVMLSRGEDTTDLLTLRQRLIDEVLSPKMFCDSFQVVILK